MLPDAQTSDKLADDPIFQLLESGKARTWREAERIYLDEAWPEIMALVASPLANEELVRHPLIQLLAEHGSRGWEDSVL